jgi:hypothetical protein
MYYEALSRAELSRCGMREGEGALHLLALGYALEKQVRWLERGIAVTFTNLPSSTAISSNNRSSIDAILVPTADLCSFHPMLDRSSNFIVYDGNFSEQHYYGENGM